MRGRPPTPTSKLRTRGTYRADRRTANEPTPPAEIPKKPNWLKGAAAAEFDRLAPKLFAAGVLTAWDQSGFIALCQVWGQYVEALALIEKDRRGKKKVNPYITTTTNNNVIQNPMVGVANKALEKYQRMASEFGLTPAARTKISVSPPPVGGEKDKSRFFALASQQGPPAEKKKTKKPARKRAVKKVKKTKKKKAVRKKVKKKKTKRAKK